MPVSSHVFPAASDAVVVYDCESPGEIDDELGASDTDATLPWTMVKPAVSLFAPSAAVIVIAPARLPVTVSVAVPDESVISGVKSGDRPGATRLAECDAVADHGISEGIGDRRDDVTRTSGGQAARARRARINGLRWTGTDDGIGRVSEGAVVGGRQALRAGGLERDAEDVVTFAAVERVRDGKDCRRIRAGEGDGPSVGRVLGPARLARDREQICDARGFRAAQPGDGDRVPGVGVDDRHRQRKREEQDAREEPGSESHWIHT